MAAVVLRIGTFIMLLALLCTGCMGAGEQGESTQKEMVRFSATVEYLDNALEELGGQDRSLWMRRKDKVLQQLRFMQER